MDTTLARSPIGHLLNGRYRVESHVARGGMADVYLGTDTRLERMVALRMDRRLQGRVEPADVVQEAYLALRGKFFRYSADPRLPCVQEALNGMDPHDREVLVLRHFEELSNAEAAQVLGIKPSAAVNRYVRALKRLKDVFQGMPGGIEGI